MPLLRLAYSALYLVALIAVYVAWGQVGGPSHLELLPWYIKLVLGTAMAFAIVRATSAAVAGERGWNGHSLRWLGLTLALGVVCGFASYYAHIYLEDEGDETDEPSEASVSRLVTPSPVPFSLPPRPSEARTIPSTPGTPLQSPAAPPA